METTSLLVVVCLLTFIKVVCTGQFCFSQGGFKLIKNQNSSISQMITVIGNKVCRAHNDEQTNACIGLYIGYTSARYAHLAAIFVCHRQRVMCEQVTKLSSD